MENFNRVFKKVFAVLFIFALFFTLNVKADENAGQVDNQVDPIEEREVDLVSPSSVPPETVSGTINDETPPVTPVEGQGEVVGITPSQTEGDGEGDGNADVPPTPTEGGSLEEPQTIPGTLNEGEGSEQTPTLPASEGDGSEQTPTLPASEGDGNESPSAPVETPASEQVPAATGTLSETPTDTVTMMAAPAAEPEAQLLGAGEGTRASEPQTVFYTNISNGKTITAKDLLAKVDITVNDEDISNVTLGETTTYLTVTNTSGIYSIKNNGSYEGTLPILITVGDTTYTINVDSGPDRSKELYDYNDGTYRLELTVTGESITTPPPINVLIIYDESSSMLKYWTDEPYGSVGHRGDDLLNDNLYYSDENPNIDSAYIASTAYVPNNAEGYFPLYKQNSDGTYSKITDEEQYTGTLYMRTGTNSYAVYNETYELDGVTKIKRFATRRADSSEYTIKTFVQDLYNANPNTNIAFVGFASYAGTSTEVNWTTTSTNVTNILSTTGDRNTYNKNLGYVSGTNYEAALQQGKAELEKLNAAGNTNKTFVIFITDGEPSQSMTDPTATPTSQYSLQYYTDTREETTWIRNRNNTTFFGIYAYGRENDYLDDLVYDAHNATPRTTITSSGDTTGITDWYFKAKNTTELESAMANIFGQIILGIGSTSITDGTTSHVVISETASSHLLDVDTNSFKYYKNKVEWADAPQAYLNADGQVIWDLGRNIILEDGVTYKVTFDVWPSQETLDLIADLKNGTKVYATLPDAIKQYLDCTGTGQNTVCTLRTNTTATLNYVDTRPNGTNNGSSLYVNPDPVPTAAVELMTINKTWNGGGAEEQVDLYVTRDENNKWYKVPITVGTTTSSGQASIAIGILTDHNNYVYLRTTGHDYTFYEDGENAYHWELNVPTYRPMLINNQPTMLEKVTKDKIEATGYIFYVIRKTETVTEGETTTQVVTERTIAVKGNQTYTPAENEEILSTSYYNMTNINEFKLSGVNERRSNLDIIKEVTGTAADKELEFRFDITVDSADSINPIDRNIWFSVADTTKGSWDPIEVTTDATPEILSAPEDATYNANDNTITFTVDGTAYTYKCVEGNSLATCKYKTNYYYVPDNTPFYVMMKNGYSLRIRNILTGSTYTITETVPSNFTTDVETYIMKDGSKVAWPKTGTETPDTSVTVNGRTVTGTIIETSVNYTVKYTNKHEVKDITLTKTWDDATNQDGIRPTTIYVKVVNNYNETVSIIAINATNATVSEDGNTWTYTITGLDKYRNGNEITYTIEEVLDATGTPIADYDENSNAVITLNKDTDGNYKYTINGNDITNSHVPQVTQINGTKTWDDNNNQDGIRPTFITVNVYQGQVPENSETAPYTTFTLTLNGGRLVSDNTNASGTITSDNVWSWLLINLPKNANGTAITYVITEAVTEVITGVDGVGTYAFEVTGNMTDGFAIKNSHTPEKVTAKAIKVWTGDEGKETNRPNLTLQLYANDVKVDGKTVTLTSGNNWTASITGLSKYAAGQAITYSFKEDTTALPDGYALTNEVTTPETNDDEVVTGYVTTLTNTYKEKELDLTKTWVDESNQDGIRPTSIRIDVLVGNKVYKTVTLTSETEGLVVNGDVWSYKITGLPFYMKGEEVNYTIAENLEEQEVITLDNDGAGHYKYTINGNDITNIHIPETIKIIISKVWEDNNNQDGIRPGSVKVALTSKTESEEEVTTEDTQKLDESNEWKYEWLDLYKYRNGELIAYDVEEVTTDVVTGEDGKGTYAIEVSKTGELGENLEFVVTNTHTPEVREIEIIKVWTDFDNKYETRPIQIVVRLYADGKEIKELILDESTEWKATVSELPVYENGKKIIYTVTEDEIELYEAVISGDMDEGFKIENFYSPKGGDNPPPPQTGDNVWMYLITLIVSLVGMGYSFYLKKRYN